MHVLFQAGLGSGLVESAAQLVSVAAAVILLGLLVAFGAFAYKSVRGEGIRWPDDDDEETGVQRSGDDDEWKYS
jgi:hypothetical protein